LRHDIN